MLGLDVTTLAVPDYEIISRLERLIEGQHELIVGKKFSSGGHYDDPTDKRPSGAIGYLSDAQRRSNIREISAKGHRGTTLVSKRY